MSKYEKANRTLQVWKTVDYLGDGHVLQERRRLLCKTPDITGSVPATQYDNYNYSEFHTALEKEENPETELRVAHLSELNIDYSKARLGKGLSE